jgi:hypothetical protein
MVRIGSKKKNSQIIGSDALGMQLDGGNKQYASKTNDGQSTEMAVTD